MFLCRDLFLVADVGLGSFGGRCLIGCFHLRQLLGGRFVLGIRLDALSLCLIVVVRCGQAP